MIVFSQDAANVVTFTFQLSRMPEALLQAARDNATTVETEKKAQDLIANDFPVQQTSDFVDAVVSWGRGFRIKNRVLSTNSSMEIRERVRNAHAFTSQDKIEAALVEIQKLNYLSVSFGSKHLKFLDPDRHVVLDSVISRTLGYPLTTDGYLRFVADCHTVRNRLIATNTLRHDGQPFRVADVEQAIYYFCKGY